jgi:hypothetical protein
MARRCGSVKNTGTDTTASVTFAPWSASAMVFRSLRIIATRRSGVKLFFSPMYCTVIMISSFGPALVGNRNVGKIACTSGSEYRRPISFFRCMIVFLGCMLILSAAAHPMKRWKIATTEEERSREERKERGGRSASCAADAARFGSRENF